MTLSGPPSWERLMSRRRLTGVERSVRAVIKRTLMATECAPRWQLCDYVDQCHHFKQLVAKQSWKSSNDINSNSFQLRVKRYFMTLDVCCNKLVALGKRPVKSYFLPIAITA